MKYIESVDGLDIIAVDKIESLKIRDNGDNHRLIARMVSGDEVDLYNGINDVFNYYDVCKCFMTGSKTRTLWGIEIDLDFDILYLEDIDRLLE